MHVKLLMSDVLDQSVMSTDHGSGHHYIMEAVASYEHIRVPVAKGEHVE